MNEKGTEQRRALSRVLGLPTLVSIIVGIGVTQIALVGVLQGVGIADQESFGLVATAFVIAVLLALTYVASFSELSLMMPSAGGLSTYTEIAIGHFPALLATFSGYVVVNMFGMPAEMILFDSIIRETFGLNIPSNLIALATLVILALLNITGTDIFAALQNATSGLKIGLMLATGLAIFWVPPVATHISSSVADVIHLSPYEAFSASIALFFWCFVAAEFVCPMIEETRSPERNIPRAMVVGIAILAVLYGTYAFGATRLLSREVLTGSSFPHLDYANAVFGRAGSALLMLFAAAATIGLINGILAGVSRMLYGMARNGQAFGFLGKVHPRYGTPSAAIIFIAVICGAPLIILGDKPETIMTLVVAASSCWLLAYIVAHVNLIVLRRRYPLADRPYRSPFFPLPQIFGIVGMTYVIASSPGSVYVTAGCIIVIVAVLSAGWVHFVMKRGLFSPEPLPLLENEPDSLN